MPWLCKVHFGTLSWLRKLSRGANGLLHIHLNFLAFKFPGFLNSLTTICMYIPQNTYAAKKQTLIFFYKEFLYSGILFTVLGLYCHSVSITIYIYTQYALYCHHIITLLYAYVNHYIVIPMTYPLFIHPIIVGWIWTRWDPLWPRICTIGANCPRLNMQKKT